MKIQSKLKNLVIKALTESGSTKTIVKIVQQALPHYDIYSSTGFPSNIPIPTISAAKQVTMDIITSGMFLNFVTVLIDVYRHGLMGRKIPLNHLPRILKEIDHHGFSFNNKTGHFEENSHNNQKNRGWGVLQEGETYEFAFLKVDIVDNTKLVRKYPKDVIQRAYEDLKNRTRSLVEKRDGRIWHWEGDGGIAAFYYEKNIKAVLTGIEIIHDLFLYNVIECPLDSPLQIRAAIHTGPCPFIEKFKDIQNDTLKRLAKLEEKHTQPDSLTLSPGVYSDLGGKLTRAFDPVEINEGQYVYKYNLKWEA